MTESAPNGLNHDVAARRFEWDRDARVVVPRDEGLGRASYFDYDGARCAGWRTINCGPDQVIARAFAESEPSLRAKARTLYPFDPEWVVLETVFRAVDRAIKLRPGASPFAFLQRILERVVLGLRRGRRPRSLDELWEHEHPSAESPPLDLPEEVRDRQRIAQRLLEELPPVEREAVRLIDVECLTLTEAARQSGRSEKALSMARRRGRARLGLTTERSRRRSREIDVS